MIYMNKITFDFTTDDDKQIDPEYFQIDALLITAVQALNLKGYTTLGSCEGHAFDDDCILNIAFADSVDLPYLPDGFYFKNCRLIKRHDTGGTIFDVEHRKIDMCEELTKWALNLPDNPLR